MATAAEPILASNIWLSKKNEHTTNSVNQPTKSPKLQTKVKALDNAFNGGLDFSSVHWITSEANHTASEFFHGLLASHLLCSSSATATVIDSTLSFDVRKLYQALEATSQNAEGAMEALNRLKIMKVFDYVGLSEAVTEVRETIESEPAEEEEEGKRPPKGTISDSEDEGGDLLDSPSPAPEPNGPPSRLLVIDNLSQLLAPLLKNNYAQGQASLSVFMRSLRQLTRVHNLCTLVLCSASGKAATEEESLSMSKSCTIRPALGNGIGQLVDMHTLLHRLPRKNSSDASTKAAEMVSVLEIVQDRYGARYGHWAPFTINADGLLEDLEA